MSRPRLYFKSLNIRFPWTGAVNAPREALPPHTRDLTETEALQLIRPRTGADKRVIVWVILSLIFAVAFGFIVYYMSHYTPK